MKEKNIQTEVEKIHHQFGISEKANYEIQKLFDELVKTAVENALLERSDNSDYVKYCQRRNYGNKTY